MTESIQLPVKNESGNYEIRLESIGGLGANLCGKMLGELGLHHLHLNSASFSSYGSEKTGTPVTAYIRYCAWDKEIRVHSPVVHPHLLCIFHDALLSNADVLAGCTRDTVIVLHTSDAPVRISGRLQQISKRTDVRALYTIPAQKIAMDTQSRINVVMLGAMANAMRFVPLTAVEEICRETLGRKYPDTLKANLAGLRAGYEAVALFPAAAGNASRARDNATTDNSTADHMMTDNTTAVRMTTDNSTADRMMTDSTTAVRMRGTSCTADITTAMDRNEASPHTKSRMTGSMPIGGLNPHFGNSVENDLSASRQGYIPLFIQERCINCGLCDSACPDMVFQFEEGTYRGREMMINRGLDYYHCKGCLRCVAVCPTQALVKGLESEHPHKEWFLPNQELIRTPDYYERAGADGYITSESYLTEKRIEGGEV